MATQSEKPTPSISDASGNPAHHRDSRFWFAATTLLGAFLVFQVQPVISKCVLPWFGGTPAVWTTCMLFFQLLLFGGYVYAHFLRTFLSPAAQGCVHLTLLASAALMLPIEPSDAWKPEGSESPTLHLLWMLAAHVGLPYFVLSSTGPLVQAWLSYRDQSDRVYRLYALSNAGSLGALLSYPFLVEPLLSVSGQSLAWSLMFCGFVIVQGILAIGLLGVRKSTWVTHESTGKSSSVDQAPTWRSRGIWVGLPALASTMLLVVTSHVCQDIAVIPFLWVLPLSLYLLSFVVCFDSPQWYKPKWIAATTLLSIVTIQTKHVLPGSIELLVEAGSYIVMLFGVCLLCHGEVARLKPKASFLTQYYMLLSAGGAIGGVIVAIVCPLLLSTHLEVPCSLALVTSLTFVMFFACRSWNQTQYDWSAAYRLRFAAAIMVIVPPLAITLAPQDETVASERNFFGVLQVLRDDDGLRLVHGRTIHGMQLRGERNREPTTYYGRESGVGLAMTALQSDRDNLKIGVVGLGCGVLATYGRARDQFDMIEINPAVVDIANEHFTFLGDSDAEIRTHLGDGRLVLERMQDRRFDLLVLDAFSSDAIPAHLLTTEAIDLYRQRLAGEGVLAIHVSNNHLDLAPLVHRLAAASGLESRAIGSTGDPSNGTQPALWMLLAKKSHSLWSHRLLADALPSSPENLVGAPLWTDQHHNLVSVLRIW